MSARLVGILAVAGPLMWGCAAQVIRTPARVIGNEVATFQGSLSGFQDTLKATQDDTRATITGSAERAAAALAVTQQLQVEWVIARAQTDSDILAALQAQGKAETARLITPATPSALPASVAFPVDKLSGVAKTLEQLSKGPTAQADLDFLSSYGKKIMTQLKALEEQAKSTTAQPAAAKK